MNKVFWSSIAVAFLLGNAFAQDFKKCPPSVDRKDLEAWRELLIKEVVNDNLSEVKEVLNFCFPDERPSCYQDLGFTIAQRGDLVRQMYLMQGKAAEGEEITIKSEKELPAEFLTKDAEGQIIPGQVSFPDNIEELAKTKGWDQLLYKTRSSGGFDVAPNLYIVAISNPTTEIYMQVSPHPDLDEKHGSKKSTPSPRNGSVARAQETLTLITVDKTKSPPVGQLRILNRKNGPGYQWNNNLEVQRCVGCHTMPLRPISPKGYRVTNGEEKLTPVQTAMVDAMNAKLSRPVSWGTTKVDGVEMKLGATIDSQPLGWAPENSKTREKKFIKECSANSPDQFDFIGFAGYEVKYKKKDSNVNYDKISQAMNCYSCHDGSVRGVLTERITEKNIHFKVGVDRSMPPGIELNDSERIALMNCLEAERRIVREQWFKSGEWMRLNSCSGKQFKVAPKMIGSGTRSLAPSSASKQ